MQALDSDKTPFLVRGLNAAPHIEAYGSSFGLDRISSPLDSPAEQPAAGMEDLGSISDEEDAGCCNDEDGGMGDCCSDEQAMERKPKTLAFAQLNSYC